MDPAVPKDAFWFFDQLWPTLVVALVIYIGGVVAGQVVQIIWPQSADLMAEKTKVVDPSLPFLFRLWHATRLAHPFMVGALIGLTPDLPHPVFVTSQTASVLWFGLAGIANGQIHMLMDAVTGQARKLVDLITPWVRKKLGLSEPEKSDEDN